MENSTNKTRMDNLIKKAGETTQWSNHLPLLFLALEETNRGTVVELGMGEGSTPWLKEYRNVTGRPLISYDNNQAYFDQFKHDSAELITEWDHTQVEGVTVVLVDHAPGERRHIDAIRYKDIKGIVVCHDTEEPPCGGNYQWEKAFKEFKYFARVKSPSRDGIHNGVWATAMSNHIDISHWHGMKIGQYTIEP